jgi:hypothetical protein
MRSTHATRRAGAVLVGLLAVGGPLLTACGSGQLAETSRIVPAIAGVDRDIQTPDGTVKIRNAALAFSEQGYRAGGNAPLEMVVFNETAKAVTVRVSTTGARAVEVVGSPTAASPSAGPPSASPTAAAYPVPSASVTSSVTAAPGGSASPGATGSPGASGSPGTSGSPSAAAPSPTAAPTSAAPSGPASLQIPPGGYVVLDGASGNYLRVVGLDEDLTVGNSLDLSFDVAGQTVQLPVTIAPPLEPLPRPSPVVGDEEGEGPAFGPEE